jgi:heptosyltransferase I
MPSFAVPFDRICLLRLSALGDLVQTVPVAQALRRVYPGARLTWVTSPAGAQLLRGIPDIDWIEVDRKDGWRAYRDLARRLAGQDFDLLLDLHPTFRANLLVPLIPARIKLGYDWARSREGNWFLTNAKLPPAPPQHAQEGFLDFARYLGITPQPSDWTLPVLPEAVAAAEKWLGPRGQQRWLIIHPAASNQPKTWLAERYAAVADFARQRGLAVALTGGGGAAEQQLVALVAAQCQGPVLNLAGRLDLQQMLAVLGQADVVISPDTGPAHMAAILGTPVIGLYASTNPGRYGPYQCLQYVVNRYPQALALTGQAEGRVAWGKKVQAGTPMELIEVDAVTQMLDRVLRERLA